MSNQGFLARTKNHSKWEKKQPRRWRIHQPDNKSNASNMCMWYTSSAYGAWTQSVSFRYSLTPCPVRPRHNLTIAKPSRSSIQSLFSESRGRPTPAPAPLRGKGRPREEGGEPSFGGLLVGFGAELRPLARHSLETGLDAGDGAAGVARFTLQEIEASVLLQDGLWGAAGVTRHIFLCGGEKTLISTSVLTACSFRCSFVLGGEVQHVKLIN